MLVVDYHSEGWHEDRDAYFWRVRFAHNDKYLGVAVGSIDGRSVMFDGPANGPIRDQWFQAGPVVVAERLAAEGRAGSLRTAWELPAVQLLISAAELTQLSAQHHEQLHPGDVVAEIDV